jgi:hypothetical protein
MLRSYSIAVTGDHCTPVALGDHSFRCTPIFCLASSRRDLIHAGPFLLLLRAFRMQLPECMIRQSLQRALIILTRLILFFNNRIAYSRCFRLEKHAFTDCHNSDSLCTRLVGPFPRYCALHRMRILDEIFGSKLVCTDHVTHFYRH